MLEDVARTVHIARQLGEPLPIADERRRPPSTTGTRTSTARPTRATRRAQYERPSEIWFLTGSQGLYGADVLDQVAEHVRTRSPPPSTRPPERPGASCSKPVLTDAGSIRRALLDANGDDRCVGVIAWMHTFTPAKMWISGLDALRKPLLHLHTQANEALPWADIDMDFMNLNQAAHGDREFGYVQTRMGVTRKTVAGHVVRPGGRAPGRRLGPGGARPRGAGDDAGRPLRRQHARRRRHRRRQGRGRAPARGLGQHLGRQRPGRRRRRRRGQGGRRPGRGVRRPLRRACRSCSPAVTGTSRCATAPGSRSGCATSSRTAASRRSPRTSRTSAACASSRVWRSSG